MKVRAHCLPLYTGGPSIVVVNEDLAAELDLHPMDRVSVTNPQDPTKCIVAHLNFWYQTEPVLGLFNDTFEKLEIKEGDEVSILPVPKPHSVTHIRDKMNRQVLTEHQVFEIIEDLVANKLTDTEIAAFITSIYIQGSSLDEAYYLTKAIAETGDTFKFDTEIVADKHCSGSVPGNRTTPVVVSTIAALGIMIPKSSSRSITSPAGTADVMEVFCDVTFTKEQILEIVAKTNGCIIWGGGLKIAPADSQLIKVRKPLHADPEELLMSSILSKKYAMGATHVMLDIPLGLETRYRNIGEARLLERSMVQIADRLGMKAGVVITDGDEPIGSGIGPVLEAIDVLKVIKGDTDAPQDLRQKSLLVGGKLLELIGLDKFNGHSSGEDLMASVLDDGRAYDKFKQIIEAQGGDPGVTVKDLEEQLSDTTFDIIATEEGQLYDIQNPVCAKVARIAGAPLNKGCGIYLHKKYGAQITKGDVLATVYCGSPDKERRVKRVLKENKLFFVK